MGGYDLYGNYYANSQDAWDAETAQMNEIDNRANRQRLDKQEREIAELKRRLAEHQEKSSRDE